MSDFNLQNLDRKQQQALELMRSGRNIFLTGYAGTGKSTVINVFRDMLIDNVVFLAPTGLAALNVQGITFHRFFELKPMSYFPESYVHKLSWEAVETIQRVRTFVVDEMSMLRSDLFSLFERILRTYPLPGFGNKPFGGRQIILAGDFCQLPPVVKCNSDAQVLLFEQMGVYAFQTCAWKDGCFQPVFLRDIYRQDKDSQFVDILNDIRLGHTCTSYPLELERHGTGIEALNAVPNITLPPSPYKTILCMTKNQAEAINQNREFEIPGSAMQYRGIVQGKFDYDSLPADMTLILKRGSRVMITANIGMASTGELCVNGDVGTVADLNSNEVFVNLNKGGYIRVARRKWSAFDYAVIRNPRDGRETVEPVEIGSYIQVPLRLAHALTVHKSQGLSLDAVHIFFGQGAFACGQTYVALSRCRSLAGLSMDRYIYPQDILVDPVVLEFDQYCRSRG